MSGNDTESNGDWSYDDVKYEANVPEIKVSSPATAQDCTIDEESLAPSAVPSYTPSNVETAVTAITSNRGTSKKKIQRRDARTPTKPKRDRKKIITLVLLISAFIVTTSIFIWLVSLMFRQNSVAKANVGTRSEFPSDSPSSFHSDSPSNNPSDSPSNLPSSSPSSSPSDSPSSSPTDHPSSYPSRSPTISFSPTSWPTFMPSFAPSHKPSTSPSSSPTSSPTFSPTNTPSVSNNPTKSPTASPSIRPTISFSPTSSPSIDFLTFYVMGDGPYNDDDEVKMRQELAKIPDTGNFRPEFVIHVGGIQDVTKTNCTRAHYKKVRDMLLTSKVPVMITPGESDIYNCPDQDEAAANWKKYFNRLNRKWEHSLPVEYQSYRPENWAIMKDFILFIGVNLPGGEDVDKNDDFEGLLVVDLDWAEGLLFRYRDMFSSVVIIGHAAPSNAHDAFFDPLVNTLNKIKVPALYIHGEGGSFRVITTPFGVSMGARIQVDNGGDAQPLKITVENSAKPFQIVRTWY